MKCNDVDQKSPIFLRDFVCFSVDCRAGSTRQQNEFKTTCAVGNCFPVIAWLRRPSNETRPHLHAWQALRGCFISQATLAVAQFNRQEKQLHNCTAIMCSCPISLPLFPQRPLQAKSAKHASTHQPNAQQGWVRLSRTFHQGSQTQLLEHMVRTYTMWIDKFDRKRMPPAMYVTNAWPCTSVDLKIRDAGLSKRHVCGWGGGWLGDRGGGGGGRDGAGRPNTC